MKILLLITTLFTGGGNDSLTLEYCYKQAELNHPNRKAIEYYEANSELRNKNLGINFLPKLTLNGQASYQSDVTELEISNPFFTVPKMNKDMYKLSLDVRQLVYDGGLTKSQEEVELKQFDIDRQKIYVELYTLKQKVNDIYFSILLLKEKYNINAVYKKDIENKMLELESKIKNGAIPPGNIYPLQAQIATIEQEMNSILDDIKGSFSMLAELTGIEFSTESKLVIPNPGNVNDDRINRPEHKLYDLQEVQFDVLSEMSGKKLLPKVSLFGQAGYGRPGLNMLKNEFEPYYMVGINFQWNPIDWGQDKNDRQIYEINKEIVRKQKETFDKNIKVTINKHKSDINKFEELLKKDEEIISIREKIIFVTESQLDNGTITSTTYLTETNNLNQARLLQKTHYLQLLQSIINYLTTKGN
jgi:outer membrane protein TolC